MPDGDEIRLSGLALVGQDADGTESVRRRFPGGMAGTGNVSPNRPPAIHRLLATDVIHAALDELLLPPLRSFDPVLSLSLFPLQCLYSV
jgi:hypothetical protein